MAEEFGEEEMYDILSASNEGIDEEEGEASLDEEAGEAE